MDGQQAGERREPSGSARSSGLPRRAASHHSNVPKADLHSVPRKSSQSSALGLDIGNASDQEPRPVKDTTESHRRDLSITSQESYDTSISESSSRRARPPATSAPTDLPPAEPSSHIPRAPALKNSSSPRQTFKRKCLAMPTDPKMADQVDNKPASASPVSKQPGSQPADPRDGSEIVRPREESDVEVDEAPARPGDAQGQVDDRLPPKVNGLAENGHGESRNGQLQDNTTSPIADSKPGSHGDDSHTDRDDDDSYPDLDDMGMEEVHRPPPRKPGGGIRWAPWNVPFKRRGQTLVVLMHSLSIVATVSIFFAFCANPFAWPLLLIYLLHVLSSKAATDGSLQYRSEWFRKSYIWHFFAEYYPAKLHKTHDLPATRKYIFGYHPHGIISHGAWAAFATDALGFSEKFPDITNSLLTLDSNFRIPFYREYLLSMGVRSVSKESMVNILNRGGPNGEGMGRGVVVVVGGARESLEAQPGMMRLVLRERKGFIKLAVRCGADLVPVLAFGENNLYDQLQPQEHPFMHQIQMFLLKVWKFTLPFLHGRGIFNYDVGLMPYRRPLNIVVGAPIKVRQSLSVNLEEINRLHGLYVAELQKLWDRYKDEFAPDRKEELQILP
ncbi:DAGAT-domain-containing protein [Nemania sp. FL0916]|nr:DAGAT-domain-containing protein [Nemania sp. FL0916]